MKRFRLSTLMLLVVIAALSFVVVMQQIRNARLMALLEAVQARDRAARAMAEAELEEARAALKAFEPSEPLNGSSPDGSKNR